MYRKTTAAFCERDTITHNIKSLSNFKQANILYIAGVTHESKNIEECDVRTKALLLLECLWL